MGRTILKKGGFIVVTIFLILLIGMCMVGTVNSQSQITMREQERYYRELEQNYHKRIRHFLVDAGYQNCGVNMTRIVDTEGKRTYTIAVNHSKFDRINEEERISLQEELDSLVFTCENSVFCYEFLAQQ